MAIFTGQAQFYRDRDGWFLDSAAMIYFSISDENPVYNWGENSYSGCHKYVPFARFSNRRQFSV